MTSCLIALGGNTGNVPRTFARALDELDGSDTRVTAVSPLMSSRPMGSVAGDAFVNGAAYLETSLSPEKLLARLHEIEASCHRDREVHWGPRTIDLDLITYGETSRKEGPVLLPHPGCWWRRFVLDPIVAIAPETIHPDADETFAQLRRRLLPRPLPVAMMALEGDETTASDDIIKLVEQRLGSAASGIRWVAESEVAAIRFVPDKTTNSPAERRLGLPEQQSAFVEMAVAVLTAATDEPEAIPPNCEMDGI